MFGFTCQFVATGLRTIQFLFSLIALKKTLNESNGYQYMQNVQKKRIIISRASNKHDMRAIL
jgi:hypothetical protein